jgi:beta-lactamase class A
MLMSGVLRAQTHTDSLLHNILSQSHSELVRRITSDADTFRLQIIYTEINRDKDNVPSFRNHYFNFDDNLYFNPASTVKLPLAFLSLEKFNRMRIKGVSKYTAMKFDSTYTRQVAVTYDSTSKTVLPSIAHYIKKALLVSDNDAYNRMYQFVGQGLINTWLREKGYAQTRIIRQFMGFNEEQNRHTNQIRFFNGKGKQVYVQPPGYSTEVFDFSRTVKVGRGYINSKDSLVQMPIDFTRANKIGLGDLQRMLQSVMFPESVPAHQRFNLTKDDLNFLYQHLSQYPSETNYPKYDTSQYYDSYVKFFFRGKRKMPSHVRVFNKVGWAYGFLTDVSYVVDFKNKVEFMLTATVYTNSDAILNDDRYDYEKVGWPFLYDLGQAMYRYELKRERQYKPDLTRFQIQYERRDLDDSRKSLRDVAN